MSWVPLIPAGLLLLLVALTAAFVSALETALFSLKEHHIAAIGDEHPELTGMMRAIVRQPRRSLHQVILLGAMLSLTLAVLGLFLLREIGLLIPGRPLLSAVVLFGALVLISELIPTVVALAAPFRVFQLLVTPFIRLSPLLETLSARFEAFTERLMPTGLKGPGELTDGEIETLVEMRRDEGALARGESEIIQDIIRLGNKTAKDCMIPRVDTFMIDSDLDNAGVMTRLRESSHWHWRVPVYQGEPDLITGLLDLRRWLYQPEEDFRDFIDPPVFVPETMNAVEAFRDYLSQPRSLRVVVDEYGGVEGILTHSDLIEEVLADAAPARDREEDFEILGPRLIRADGDARLDKIGEALGVELDHEGLDTIGGLVFNKLGRVPRPGAVVTLKNLKITVRRCRRQRITAVEIEHLPVGTGGASPPSAEREKT